MAPTATMDKPAPAVEPRGGGGAVGRGDPTAAPAEPKAGGAAAGRSAPAVALAEDPNAGGKATGNVNPTAAQAEELEAGGAAEGDMKFVKFLGDANPSVARLTTEERARHERALLFAMTGVRNAPLAKASAKMQAGAATKASAASTATTTATMTATKTATKTATAKQTRKKASPSLAPAKRRGRPPTKQPKKARISAYQPRTSAEASAVAQRSAGRALSLQDSRPVPPEDVRRMAQAKAKRLFGSSPTGASPRDRGGTEPPPAQRASGLEDLIHDPGERTAYLSAWRQFQATLRGKLQCKGKAQRAQAALEEAEAQARQARETLDKMTREIAEADREIRAALAQPRRDRGLRSEGPPARGDGTAEEGRGGPPTLADDLVLAPSTWNRRYAELRAWREAEGHTNLTKSWNLLRDKEQKSRRYAALSTDEERAAYDKQYCALACWLSKQRTLKRRGELDECQVALLDVLEVNWSPSWGPGPDKWLAHYEDLKRWQQEHGTTRVGRRKNPFLCEWVKKQNQRKLTDERIRLLNEIGFQWSAPMNNVPTWDDRFCELCAYREREGHCHVKWQDPQHKSLSNWVGRMRNLYQDKSRGKHSAILTDERIKRLEEIGFLWSTGGSGKYDRTSDNDHSGDTGMTNGKDNFLTEEGEKVAAPALHSDKIEASTSIDNYAMAGNNSSGSRFDNASTW